MSDILTVSQVTDHLASVLRADELLADVMVMGEISNSLLANSGHFYFSLKDANATLSCVMWRTSARALSQIPQEGQRVVVHARTDFYAPRGQVQLIVDAMRREAGIGDLYLKFEQTKTQLQAEGLFDPARKRALPLFPRRIGLVTSPTGAALRDFLRVASARWPLADILLAPSLVQGDQAPAALQAALFALYARNDIDVIVLARGGGSIEDLWAFNDEGLARLIARSPVPIVTGIGHETDFTIADFVADLRAPTPSAAAERVVQAKEELAARVHALDQRLVSAMALRMTRIRNRVAALTSHRVFEAERGRLRAHVQGVADRTRRCRTGLARQFERARALYRQVAGRLEAFRWDRLVAARRERLGRQLDRIEACFRADMEVRRSALQQSAAKLDSLSPLAVLGRGYALVWDARRGRLVRSPREVAVGDPLRIRVHGGVLDAAVTGKEAE